MKEQKNIIFLFKIIKNIFLNIYSIFCIKYNNTIDININKPELSPFDKITKDLYKEFKD